jgi:hypothetical protein
MVAMFHYVIVTKHIRKVMWVNGMCRRIPSQDILVIEIGTNAADEQERQGNILIMSTPSFPDWRGTTVPEFVTRKTINALVRRPPVILREEYYVVSKNASSFCPSVRLTGNPFEFLPTAVH